MVQRPAALQADSDAREAAAMARYRTADPLGAYRAFHGVVEEARTTATAHARLDVALAHRHTV